MSKYDSQYFFIRKPSDRKTPFLVPDEATADRRFRFEAQAAGSAPLVFSNGWREKFKAEGVTARATDVLFAGADLVVRAAIREQLLALSVPHLSFHPVVYVDDKDERHADYWYMTFDARFDCWNRAASEYDDDEAPIGLGDTALHQVYTYCLDERMLDDTPPERRLLFKMGGDLNAFVVCHESLAGIFAADGTAGAELQAVADY